MVQAQGTMAKIFRLKQFEICQEESALKVGTDGMLLGGYIAHHFQEYQPKTVLDVGTGTGIIALMLAQAFPTTHITGIELDSASAKEASYNASHSRFADRVTILEQDYRDYRGATHYDLILSNPPYYTPTHQNNDQRETVAKHSITLSPEQFFATSLHHLAPQGQIATILATSAQSDYLKAANEYDIYPQHHLYIQTTQNKTPKRVLTLWSQELTPCTASHLTILAGAGTHNYTPEYTQLLRPYLTIL